MSVLKKTAGIAWKIISILCTIYVCWIGLRTFGLQRICDRPGSYSLVTSDSITDRKVKATVFSTDCGAMTPLRTIINFSNALVDGRTLGETVLVLKGFNSRDVRVAWPTHREFVVTYPAVADVEFAVAKTHGVSIKLQPE